MNRFSRFMPVRWWSPRAWKAWGNYVHWRLETYGVYYPDGKLHRKALVSLLHQLPTYHRWLILWDRDRMKSLKIR